MRNFSGVQRLVRKNYYLYRTTRTLAPYLCRYFNLEHGFEILSQIYASEDSIALDVGSNDGTSIALITRNFGLTKIVSIDPVRAPLIPRNMLNLVDYRELSLGSKHETVQLYTPIVGGKKLTQYSSIDRDRILNQLFHDLGLAKSKVSFKMKSYLSHTLDSLELNPFFIKIDTEGSELEILRGSIGTIEKCLPIILVEIQSEDIYDDFLAFFDRMSYRNFNIEKINRGKISLIESRNYDNRFNNFVWLPDKASLNWRFLNE